MSIIAIIINVLVLIGASFVLIAALGVFRFPDFYTRIHAATKAGAFGGALCALAAGLHFLSASGFVQAILIIFFFYITTPVAGHLLGRAAYLGKVSLYSKNRMP